MASMSRRVSGGSSWQKKVAPGPSRAKEPDNLGMRTRPLCGGMRPSVTLPGDFRGCQGQTEAGWGTGRRRRERAGVRLRGRQGPRAALLGRRGPRLPVLVRAWEQLMTDMKSFRRSETAGPGARWRTGLNVGHVVRLLH